MNFIPQQIADVILIEPKVFQDERGFFLETYHLEKYAEGGIDVTFVQDNHSRSDQNILRGLHAQLGEFAQSKLVRCVEGEILDVAVDIRRGSPTFGKWCGQVLSAENFKQLFIPAGFAHGFYVLSESAQVQYKCDQFYSPQSEISILWNDPEIGVDWQLIGDPVLSAKDKDAKPLSEQLDLLPEFQTA